MDHLFWLKYHNTNINNHITQVLFDYEVDSDCEWEEEEPGNR